MKKGMAVVVVFSLLVVASTFSDQVMGAVSIVDSNGGATPIPNPNGILSNLDTESISGLAVDWKSFDYQAAIFKELQPSDRFVLVATVLQIEKNADGSFNYYVYLGNLAFGKYLSDTAVIVTPKRVKGLDVDANGVFYCAYSKTEKFSSTDKLTNKKSQIDLPIFAASLYGLKVNRPVTEVPSLLDLANTGTPQDVQAAIDKGAPVNVQTPDYKTPLMLAAWYNPNPEVITILLRAGADIKASDDIGETALMVAAGYNPNPEVVTILLKAGADLQVRDENGYTVLMYAATNPNSAVATALLNAGANANDAAPTGWTPLILASRDGPNPDVITILLKAGANAKATIGGKTAFDFAGDNRNLKNTEAYRQLQQASQ